MTNSDDSDDITERALAEMKRAAPERAVMLQKLFDGHGVRVRYTSRHKFEQGEVVDPSPNALWGIIQFPPIMHTVAWLLAHGGWEAMRNYGAAIITCQMTGKAFSGADVEKALTQFPDTARCIEIIDCAVRNVQGSETPPPAWLPNINETSPDSETNLQYAAVQQLWLIAQCWFLLHELQHILFRDGEKTFPDVPRKELACDANATSWLLDGVDCYGTQTNEPPEKVRPARRHGEGFFPP